MSAEPGGTPYIIAGWEITSQCNLRCPHCYTAARTRPHDEMGTEVCKGVIEAMAEIGVRMIGWMGGEPLLREDLEELTAYAGERGINCNITTNGVLLDRRRAEGLVAAGLRAFQISLDGSTPERNTRMRGTDEAQFEKIVAGIRVCKELGARVFLAMLIGEENMDDGARMVELAKRGGVDAVRFCGYTPAGRGRRRDVKSRLGFTDVQRLLEFAETMEKDASMVIDFDVAWGPVPPTFGFHQCTAGVETFYLKGNGDIYPCTALSHRRFRVGNIRQRPLPEIWHSPEMSAMSRYPRERVKEPCRSCDNFSACRGACRAGAFVHTGDLDAAHPLCLYLAARERAAVRR